MPKYEINVNNKKYLVDTNEELNQSDYDNLVSNIKLEQKQQQIKDLPKNLANVGYNTLRKVGQGATFGQGAHVEGIYDAYGGALYNLLHGENPFKDVKQDYVRAREQAKKDYKKFEEEHPYLSFGAEILGSIPTGGGVAGGLSKLSKINQIAKLAKNPITRAGVEGALYGGAYGLSNTEGKGADLTGAALGTGFGGILGAGLGALGNKAKEFWTKEGKDFKQIGQNILNIAKNPEEILLEKQAQKQVFKYSPEEYLQKAEEARIKGDILSEGLYKEKAKLAKEVQMGINDTKPATIGELAEDENISSHILKIGANEKQKALAGDKRAQDFVKKATDKQLYAKSGTYKDELGKNLKDVNTKISEIGDEIYKPYNNATFTVDNNRISNIINNFEKNAVNDEELAVVQRAKDKLKNILNRPKTIIPAKTEPEIVNGWQILPKQTAPKEIIEPVSVQELRKVKQDLYDLAQETFDIQYGREKVNNSLGGRKAREFYDKLRQELTEQAGTQIQGLRQADNLYSSMLNANRKLVSAFGKNYANGDVVNKVLSEIRDRKAPVLSNLLEEIETDIGKDFSKLNNPFIKEQSNIFKSLMENISDNTKLLQISYSIKPQGSIPVVGKRLNTRTLFKTGYEEINAPWKKWRNFMLYSSPETINQPARQASSDLFRTTIEKKAAQKALFSKPKNNLYSQAEKQQIRNNLTGFYNRRLKDIIDLINRGGLVPKASIRAIMDKYYNKEQ